MKLRILGCSGSVGSKLNPASGYLLSRPGHRDILLDCGPGVLAALAEHSDPSQVHMLFSHLHADHCLDFPSLLVWRRYHPIAPATAPGQCFGPVDTPVRLGRLSTNQEGEIDDMSDTFHFTAWQDQVTVELDGLLITPFRVAHPIETYALRIVDPETGITICYSGDSGPTPALIAAAAQADLFICEATWGASAANKPADMHLSGGQAGEHATAAAARHLVLVHLPPWGDPAGALAAASGSFGGPVQLGAADMLLEIAPGGAIS